MKPVVAMFGPPSQMYSVVTDVIDEVLSVTGCLNEMFTQLVSSL